MAQALIRFMENQMLAVDAETHPFLRGVYMIPGHGNVVGLRTGPDRAGKNVWRFCRARMNRAWRRQPLRLPSR